MLLSNQIFELE